ncbi:MAG TPA: rhomboid family intramembrane serine protease [bacterium]|nr:rhomboid family intramembrane serine protease [bacterium]HOL47371.1 rhomboid family intramembrane serine protease [bacterium]HPQ18896.1 rhomboid family intramembrane serine protease [bacterium]
MAFYNSDFHRNYFHSFHQTLIGRIIIINSIIFLLAFFNVKINNYSIINLFGLLPADLLKFKIWQIFTYMFVHSDIMHLFWNMLTLLMFGIELERLWGAKELFKYYLICGAGAAVFSFLFINNTSIYIIGASGAIFGLMLAYSKIYPDSEILFFFVFPIKIKYAVIILAIISLLLSFDRTTNIAHFTHLGGFVIGYLYLFFQTKTFSFQNYIQNIQQKKRKNKLIKLDKEISLMQSKVDELLKKISESGINSLTKSERKILLKASELIKQKDEI